MAFKMKGMNFGKGTGSAFTKEVILPEEEQQVISDTGKSSGRTEQAIIDADAKNKVSKKMTKTTRPLKPKTEPKKTIVKKTSNIVDKDELKRAGKAGEVTRRGDDASIVGEIKGRLAERAGKTEKKTRKFLGRTWTKTKKYDKYGKKIGKKTEVVDRGGAKIKHRQKGDMVTDEPVVTQQKIRKRRKSETLVTPKVEKPKVEKKSTKKYTDLPEDQRAAARTYNIDTYGTHNPTAAAKKAGITKAELAKRYKASKK